MPGFWEHLVRQPLPNCDYNFGTFNDFGVKNDQKVSHNMILMSKYKGQHCGKTGSKNSGRGL